MSRGITFWGEDGANAAWPESVLSWPEAVLEVGLAWAEPWVVADVVRKVDREASIRYWFNTKELRWAFVNVANQGEPFVAMHGGRHPTEA